jgi:hypothetical protein
MAFMDRFNQQSQQPRPQSNRLNDVIAQARQLASQSGGAQAAIEKLSNDGVMCTMPSGRQMSVADIVGMSKGKTTGQLLMELLRA